VTDAAAATRRPWWRSSGLVVFVVASAYACVVTYPLVFNLGSMIYGYPGDATGTVATYEFWAQALRQHQSIFENNVWGAPYGAGWQAVPFAVSSVVALAPLSAVFGGIGAYNLEVLASFPLTAWTTYLVARRFGCRSLGAAFAGLAFAFIPYHIEKAQGHAGQTHMELFSATLLFLVRWRQSGSRWNLAGAGVVAGITLWIDYYFAFIDAFLVATFFAASFLYGRAGESWLPRLRTHVVAGLILGLTTVAFVPVTVLVAERGSLASSLTAQTASFNQSLAQIRVYSSRPLEFLLPYHANPLVPKQVVDYEISRLHSSNFTEQSLFIGYVVMALAALWVLARWRRFETVLLLAIGIVGFMVSLPPGINFHGYVIPTPSLLLNPFFPIFRVYARFGILVLLGAAVLAGLGLTLAQERLRGRAALLLAIPFVLTALEFNSIPPTHVLRILPAPAAYQWLETQPTGILVEYPLAASTPQTEEIQTHQYELYQPVHGHPIFNGATTASQAYILYPGLEPYYGPGVAGALRSIGVRYVFVHRNEYLQDGYLLPHDVPTLTFIQTMSGTDIYEVT
jgi:hypothetical protein